MRQIFVNTFKHRPKNYFNLSQLAAAGFGSFAAIAIIAYVGLYYDLHMLFPAFGASAVLLFGAPEAPMARPKNVLGGHLVSAFVGVTVYQIFGYSWWSLALSVSLAIVSMIVTDTTHPPGGATAFISVFMQKDYSFIFTTVLSGLIVLMAVAAVVNKLNGILKHSHIKQGETTQEAREKA